MTTIDSSLDREELHEVFQQKDLVWILNRMREGDSEQLNIEIERFGKEIKEEVNKELVADYGTPLNLKNWFVGYLTLVYEAENDILVEQEVMKLRPHE